ncbi:MAG: aldo/keto reductase [Wenzhouxiangellaceae bacterium]|nr:aldo/keto reductase [Wenzhouxiangellaceae bacterium]MBS3747495.1 aldo/keto reductase [Wenzhouxiangellaceae bacterium]
MQKIRIPGTQIEVSRVALGTWAIGGWMWGGTEEERSIATVHAALDKGVDLVDTAPVYGFGTSEKIVGKALEQYGGRDKIHISTKVALEWDDGDIFRNASRDRIMREVEDSLKRLRTSYLDIYHVHWPDPTRPMDETARAMRKLFDDGVIRAVGVSNFTPDQMTRFREDCPIHVCQPPYNIFERSIESDIKPYCEHNDIALMTYGALCRGMLTGKMTANRKFEGDDLRNNDPKFQQPRFGQYLEAVDNLQALARERFGRSLIDFSVRWILEKNVPIAIWGGRKPGQMDPLDDVFGWSMDGAALSAVDSILAEAVKDPVGPEFMAPPTGLG